MTKKRQTSKDAAEMVVKNIRCKTCQTYSAEEKIRIFLAGLRGEESTNAAPPKSASFTASGTSVKSHLSRGNGRVITRLMPIKTRGAQASKTSVTEAANLEDRGD